MVKKETTKTNKAKTKPQINQTKTNTKPKTKQKKPPKLCKITAFSNASYFKINRRLPLPVNQSVGLTFALLSQD